MTDTSDYNMSWCEFYRASAIANRKTKIYILGDSLVAIITEQRPTSTKVRQVGDR